MVDLPFIWALVIGFAVMMYILLDGFDLGVGILFSCIHGSESRHLMMNSVIPLWDGNETWLVLGGAGLFAAFPKAYALILSALYLPLMMFLGGLILRGVSFEFRYKATRYRRIWDLAFCFGSILAAFMQGIVLGNFVQGLPITHNIYTGGVLSWISTFSIMTGCAMVAGYGLLGATWLIWKTSGELQEKCRRIACYLGAAVLFFIGLVSLWTPLIQPEIAMRWFSWPNILYFLPVPFYTLMLAGFLFWSIIRKREIMPFLASLGLFFLSYTGLIISLWPYIVPRSLTIWQAASPPESQLFALVGVLFLLPLILFYTVHAYVVFHGKVSDDIHY